jgi:hypothetical protein
MAQPMMNDIDKRGSPRDEVHYRTRAILPDGQSVQVLVVNMSARGLMARCDAPLVEGDRVRVRLPVVGTVAGDVRWALGGRFGCELEHTIALAPYMMMLAAMPAQR